MDKSSLHLKSHQELPESRSERGLGSGTMLLCLPTPSSLILAGNLPPILHTGLSRGCRFSILLLPTWPSPFGRPTTYLADPRLFLQHCCEDRGKGACQEEGENVGILVTVRRCRRNPEQGCGCRKACGWNTPDKELCLCTLGSGSHTQ